MTGQLTILYEDNHLLALAKPAGLATMGTGPGEPSLWLSAREYLKERYHKPGNVYLGVVSRLDAPVTGIVVFARTSKAAARLSEQFREGLVNKLYWALVVVPPQPAAGVWRDCLAKDERRQRMVIIPPSHPGAKEALVRYQVLASRHDVTLVSLAPETGRKHQLRVQLAAHGCPILGDRKYGSLDRFPAGIALHARRLEIVHPVRREPLVFECAPPASWRKYGF